MIQWASYTTSDSSTSYYYTVTFPAAFNKTCIISFIQDVYSTSNTSPFQGSNYEHTGIMLYFNTATSFVFNSTGNSLGLIYYLAIGY